MKTYENSFGCIDVSTDMSLYYERILKDERFQDVLNGKKLSIDDFVNSMITLCLFGMQEFFSKSEYPEPNNIRILDAHGYADDEMYCYVEEKDDKF